MYFAKARKQMEEQDMREVQEKLEKYQRSDTARVQLQQAKSSRATEDGSGSRRSSRGDFRPDELPDGAFVSPKHTPSHASPAKSDAVTVSKTAEYIGSFSVTGQEEDARARQVETQLEALRSVTKSKKVLLIISLEGIKVCSGDGQNVYMFHELKRISYATCDPDHCQFSFLAREKQMNLQYCHAFLTQTPQQAEELNLIIGNAFKMAYAQQRDRQPTFHELIEAQVAEQQAKFREIEKQAQVELQRKLAEIARPTPFSQQAIQWMEQRRQTLEDLQGEPEMIVGKNKLWAKESVAHVQHRISLHEAYLNDPGHMSTQGRLSDPSPVLPAMLRRREAIGRGGDPDSISSSSESGSGQSKPSYMRSSSSSAPSAQHAHRVVTKHNSAPLFPAQVSSPSDDPPGKGEAVSCVIPHHPLSAQAIRVSMETKKDGKFKGSPVTALKNEIDKRYLSNGSETAPLESAAKGVAGLERETDQKAVRQEMVRQQIHMASRPLPQVPGAGSSQSSSPSTTSPAHNNNNNGSTTTTITTSSGIGSGGGSSSNTSNVGGGSRGSPRQRPTSTYQCRSFEDHHYYLPSSSSSPSPLSAAKQQTTASNGVSIRNSPRRKQARPLSEIATCSSGGGGGGCGSGMMMLPPGAKGYDNWHPMNLYEPSPALASAAAAAATTSSSSSASTGVSPKQSPRHQSSTPSGSSRNSTPPNSSPQNRPHHQPPASAPTTTTTSSSSSSAVVDDGGGGGGGAGDGGLYIYGPVPSGVVAEMRAGGKGPRFEPRGSQEAASRGSGCPSGNTEPVLRYQNDSPFQQEDPEAAGKTKAGLESLMCLDRSHIEDPALRQASWYQAGIPREIALEILQQEEVGSFIVRDSTTHPGCFALSVRVPKFENSAGISHYLILKTQRGVKLKGLDKEWPTLTALVTHHTVMPEMLPCTLRLPRNIKNLTFREAEREEGDDDPTYQRLTDVTAMAGQLKL